MLATNTKIDELIALGTKQGQLYDTQVVEMLDGLEDVDFNVVYEAIKAAHIKIISDDNALISDAGSESVDPATDWGGGSMDSVSIYLHEIGQYNILTKEEEHRLALEVRDGQLAQQALDEGGNTLSEFEQEELKKMVSAGGRAKNKLVEANLRFVVSIARRYQNNGLPLLDLIQSGNMGLMRGIDEFDPDKGFRLTTYTGWWIKQAIVRDIANYGRTIRIPVHVVERVQKINSVYARLLQEFGFEPTDEMIAAEVGMTVEKIRECRKVAADSPSLDTYVGDDANTTFGDMIEDEEALNPAEVAENKALRETLLNTMAVALNPREEDILIRRFGFNGPPQTLEEIGQYYGLTRERVRQLILSALRKMSTPYRKKAYTDFLEN